MAARPGGQAEVARQLGYRPYTVCERQKRAQAALGYNALLRSWPEIARPTQTGGRGDTGQTGLFEEDQT